jgi:hypothetical protein
MKRTILKLKIIAVLASLIYPGFAVPTHASDFFPIDLWEEMTGWQHNKDVVNEKAIGAENEPRPKNWGIGGAVHTTFPLDVCEELNALGNGKWHDLREYFANIGNTHRNKTNPYWLPEEFTTGTASGLTAMRQTQSVGLKQPQKTPREWPWLSAPFSKSGRCFPLRSKTAN